MADRPGERHIFISYRRVKPDMDFAYQLADDLEAAGHPVWIDVEGIEGGEVWNEEIQRGIDECYAYVVVLSPDSMGSRWVRNELLYTLGEKPGRVYPVMYRYVKLPPELVAIQYVDFQDDYDSALDDLLGVLPKPPSLPEPDLLKGVEGAPSPETRKVRWRSVPALLDAVRGDDPEQAGRAREQLKQLAHSDPQERVRQGPSSRPRQGSKRPPARSGWLPIGGAALAVVALAIIALQLTGVISNRPTAPSSESESLSLVTIIREPRAGSEVGIRLTRGEAVEDVTCQSLHVESNNPVALGEPMISGRTPEGTYDEIFTFVANTPGTYRIVCEGMVQTESGEIAVAAAANPLVIQEAAATIPGPSPSPSPSTSTPTLSPTTAATPEATLACPPALTGEVAGLSGVGMQVWKVHNVEGGDPAAIVARMQEAGLSYIVLKVADGPSSYNVDLAAPVVEALHEAGLQAWGWQYVYGGDPIAEAEMAIERVTQLGLDGFVVDAENDYLGKYDSAQIYMDALREGLPTLPIGLSSFGLPVYYPDFPWTEFLSQMDVNMPRVYWVESNYPDERLELSIAQFSEIEPRLPIVPTGAAYEEFGWRPHPAEITLFTEEANRLGLASVNFWSWDYAGSPQGADLWNAIADLNRCDP
jgi:hypothetical protein